MDLNISAHTLQKRPIYAPKSPTYPQKNPIDTLFLNKTSSFELNEAEGESQGGGGLGGLQQMGYHQF